MVTDEDAPNKNIAIKLYVYERLLARKHGNDTFSDVIERLLNNTFERDP